MAHTASISVSSELSDADYEVLKVIGSRELVTQLIAAVGFAHKVHDKWKALGVSIRAEYSPENKMDRVVCGKQRMLSLREHMAVIPRDAPPHHVEALDFSDVVCRKDKDKANKRSRARQYMNQTYMRIVDYAYEKQDIVLPSEADKKRKRDEGESLATAGVVGERLRLPAGSHAPSSHPPIHARSQAQGSCQGGGQGRHVCGLPLVLRRWEERHGDGHFGEL